ncbi:hypothetical protein GBAR_LOCUS6037, partial [Geodia barretti]
MFLRISAVSRLELEMQSVHGRRGATEIRITDNDPMIIGFTDRIKTVSEGEVPGVDLFRVEVNVASQRTAEREHPMVFRLLESVSNA